MVEEIEAFLKTPDLLTDADKRFLMAHDIANRRARGESLHSGGRYDVSGASFGDMLKAVNAAERSKPLSAGEEFAQRYLVAKESDQENPHSD